jgi:hypothetical protein
VRTLAETFYRWVLVLWIGGHCTVGYLVAPLLFTGLGDRQLAGLVAGRFFALIGWIGLAGGAYLLLFLIARWRASAWKRSVFWLTLTLLMLVAVGQFGIQPLMAQFKADALPRDVMDSALRDRFVLWHGLSQVVYGIETLLGLWLAAWMDRGLR